jgi:hypothetical protein
MKLMGEKLEAVWVDTKRIGQLAKNINQWPVS